MSYVLTMTYFVTSHRTSYDRTLHDPRTNQMSEQKNGLFSEHLFQLTREFQWIKENYESLLGVGLGYVWLCGLLGLIDWWNAREFILNAIAFGGMALVSIVMLGTYMHMNKQEQKIKELEERIYYLKESQR